MAYWVKVLALAFSATWREESAHIDDKESLYITIERPYRQGGHQKRMGEMAVDRENWRGVATRYEYIYSDLCV